MLFKHELDGSPVLCGQGDRCDMSNALKCRFQRIIMEWRIILEWTFGLSAIFASRPCMLKIRSTVEAGGNLCSLPAIPLLPGELSHVDFVEAAIRNQPSWLDNHSDETLGSTFLSTTSNSDGGIGLPQKYPCTSSHPSFSRRSICSWVSTPSAITARFILWAS